MISYSDRRDPPLSNNNEIWDTQSKCETWKTICGPTAGSCVLTWISSFLCSTKFSIFFGDVTILNL